MGNITRKAYTLKQILASNEGHDALSVTLVQDAAAIAETEAGLLLGKITATGKYAKYDDGAADGTEVAVGVLKTPVSKEDRIAGDEAVSMYYTGRFREDKLVGLDAAALVDLKGRTVEGITYF